MPQPANETRLGELLVNTGKLSSEELLAALETQRQQVGTQRKRLGEILVEQGQVSPLEIRETLSLSFSLRQQANDRSVTPPNTGDNSEQLPDDVLRAMADPHSRVGRYVVLSELGRGGMGVVFRGYDPNLRREVAIKMLVSESAAGNEKLVRFMREAQACAKLRHPSIVAVHEVGEQDGYPYLVMDLVRGRVLADVIESDGLSSRGLAGIMRKLALALNHAHDAGIIHRDVKPQNIMLDEEGSPLLMDFGVARDISARQHLTQTGQMLGTPLYMAPEQVRGTGLGPWTDVYALGAVLYHALTSQPPFHANEPATLFKMILFDEPEPLRRHDPSISPDLETIALKCLEKESDRRYPSAAAVADELQRFLDGQAILARPIGRSERVIRWTRRNRALSVALAVVVVVVVGALIGGIAMYRTNQSALIEANIAAERDAARREERARLAASQAAKEREEEAARLKEAEVQARLRSAVMDVLARVRSGVLLEDPDDGAVARAELLNYREPETVHLLTIELDALSRQLAESHALRPGQELFLHFLCETLWNLNIREPAVTSLARYLQAECSLPAEVRNQLRAVPAGKALCLLGGEDADRLLLEAKRRFGPDTTFWRQVQPSYIRTGVEPVLEEETAEGYFQRGMIRQAKGYLDGAIADFDHVIEMDPNHVEAWINRGVTRKAKGYLDDAIAAFSRAIELDPNVAIVWSHRGGARHDKGDLDGAIADATRAIEIDSNLATSWNHRGNARRDKGDLDGAIADLSRAIELDPNVATAWSNRGVARQAKEDPDGAIADATRAIEIDPNLATAWTNRGNARQAKGHLNDAIADHTHAIAIDPRDARAWFSLGRALRANRELESAVNHFTRAIDLAPDFAEAFHKRGEVRRGMGGHNAALADFNRAIEINPNSAVFWASRALVRRDKGDLDGAIADGQRFLELDPDHPAAPTARIEIDRIRQLQAEADR